MADERLRVLLELQAGQYKREAKEAAVATDSISRSAKDTGTSMNSLGTKMGGVASAAKGFLAVAAVGAVGAFAKGAIDSFSRLEQAVGGTEAVFGDNADEIETWAKTAAESFGLSEAEARTATTAIGGQLKRMTGDLDFATEHSKALVEVGADLAATYGGTTAEAVQALGSAFRGEADPAERFNLDLKVGKVNAKALELGLADTNGKIDDQAKAQALLALITEQSADAVGQFGREQETVAGQTQILNAKLEDQKAAVGEKLAGPWQTLQGLLIGALDQFTKLEDIAKNPFTDALGESFHALGDAIGLTTNPAIGENVRLTEDARTHGLDYLSVVNDLTAATGDQAGATRDATVALQNHRDTMRALADPYFAAIEANRELAESQVAATEAAAEFGDGSPEHVEALGRVRDASYDVQDAAIAMAGQTGTSRSQMETHLRSLAAFTEEQIAIMLAEFDKINAFVFVPKSVTITRHITGGGPQMHSGGIVPGPRGAEVPIIALAGERVIPIGQAGSHHGSGSGGITIGNLNLNGLPGHLAHQVGQAMALELRMAQ